MDRWHSSSHFSAPTVDVTAGRLAFLPCSSGAGRTKCDLDALPAPRYRLDMAKRNWRRTSFRRVDGSIDVMSDDWSLLDDAGRPLARIYLQTAGPLSGRWAWFVLVAPNGTPFNGGSGEAATGTEAREICEAMVPPGSQEGGPCCEGGDEIE
jgi:hypothetical protein